MRLRLLWVVLLFWLTACTDETPTPMPTATPLPAITPPAQTVDGIIVAMGDSLTEGLGVNMDEAYPAQLERKLRAAGYNYTVINAGVSGETTTGALARVDWVLTLKPNLVILATGGNDSLRAVDPALTKANIRKLVQSFQAAHVPVILAGMQTVQNLGEEYTNAFSAIYPAVAEEYQLPLIPFFLVGVAGDPKLNQPDFIHPTAEGYTVIVETIYPFVVEALTQLKQ
ncbi:MAG: arylesterase [Caldilinea sp. CFX5]|nr:arylesterase [Caldilinea sp. CFX5]